MKCITRMIAIISLAAQLAGCDKCGDLLKLDLFGQPKTCSGANPRS